MPKKEAKKTEKGDNTTLQLALQPKEGEIIMAVCHIYASFNDTSVLPCTSLRGVEGRLAVSRSKSRVEAL